MKVMYNGNVSNFNEDPNKYNKLVKGKVYRVTYLNQSSCSTSYRLENCSDTYNSECFDLVGKYHALASKVPTIGQSLDCRVLVSLSLGRGYMRYQTSVVENVYEIEAGNVYEVRTKNCNYLVHMKKR